MWKVPGRGWGICGLISVLLLVPLASFLGCSDPTPYVPAPPSFVFKDLTEPDNIIHNLLLSYTANNIAEYSKLLLAANDSCSGKPYASEYIWYNQPNTCCLDEFLLRDDDIASTNNLFLAAKGTPAEPNHQVIDRLILMITDGSWSPLAEIFGEACEDCWFTEREYNIRLYYGENAIAGLHDVQFYIVPVDEGGTKIYKIAVAKDIRRD